MAMTKQIYPFYDGLLFYAPHDIPVFICGAIELP